MTHQRSTHKRTWFGKVRRFLFLCLLGAGLFVLGVFTYAWIVMFGPGITKQQTAGILVGDYKLGARARWKAIWHGDRILPFIVAKSANFERLNHRNSFWIADVLGQIRTEKSRAILFDLFNRTNRLARLTGAIGLLQQGAFPEPITPESFLVQTVRDATNQVETKLAIIALGHSRDTNALPCLLALLERKPSDYWYHAYACEAVARIGSPEAIPVLRECLRNENFYALPQAFRALIALGDREAVPLAINRISPEIRHKNSGFVVRELRRVTGKSYGHDRAAWQRWWQSVEGSWQIPKKFRQKHS